MTASLRRVRVSLGLPKSGPAYVTGAYYIVECMDGNTWFPAPVPSLADVKSATDALRDAEATALYAGGASKAARDDRWRELKALMQLLRAYVEGVANSNLEHAEAIVKSAGMAVVVTKREDKRVLSVRQGRVSGLLILVARMVAKECRYSWQMSADAGKSWIDLTPTVSAKTTVSGLEPGKTYLFRVRGTARKVSTTWCDPVPFLVK